MNPLPIRPLLSVLPLAVALGLLVVWRLRERAWRGDWVPFRDAFIVSLPAGHYRIRLRTPRRLLGPLLDPDVTEGVVCDARSGVPIHWFGASGMLDQVRGMRTGVSDHTYERTRFALDAPTEVRVSMVLAQGRDGARIDFCLERRA